jgi:nucleotide-binding universal stress UspA family protein
MKNILVPTDFSDISDFGLHVAAQIAKKANAHIHLLNLIAPPLGNTFSVTGDVTKTYAHGEDVYVSELLRANNSKLSKIAGIHSKDGIKITPAVNVEPWQEGIKDYIDKHHIDLVVMGTSGESSFDEYFVGNHTEQVIRVSNKPVLTVRDYHTNFSLNDIVLAVDFDTKTYEAIGQINNLARVFYARLHLLHVRDSGNDNVAEEERKLRDFAEKHHLLNYTVHSIKHSDEVEGIRKFSKANNADVIAIITHARSGLSKLFKESISENLIKEAKTPVLSVHIED